MFLLFYTICLSSWQKKGVSEASCPEPQPRLHHGCTAEPIAPTDPHLHFHITLLLFYPKCSIWKLFQNCLYKFLKASEKFKVHDEVTLFFDWSELQFFPNLRYNIYTYMYICIMYHIYICIYNIYICYIYNTPIHWYQQCVTVHHVLKCMSCHKAIVVITRRSHCFHNNIYKHCFHDNI